MTLHLNSPLQHLTTSRTSVRRSMSDTLVPYDFRTSGDLAVSSELGTGAPSLSAHRIVRLGRCYLRDPRAYRRGWQSGGPGEHFGHRGGPLWPGERLTVCLRLRLLRSYVGCVAGVVVQAGEADDIPGKTPGPASYTPYWHLLESLWAVEVLISYVCGSAVGQQGLRRGPEGAGCKTRNATPQKNKTLT